MTRGRRDYRQTPFGRHVLAPESRRIEELASFAPKGDMRTDLVANVLDLSGDQLDEIVLWDEKRNAPKTAPPT